jgi:two-component system, OmpR family, response regulator MtrA
MYAKDDTMALKILTIDDDPAMTELLSLLLRSHGMEVVACNDGERGIQLARTESPDLILLDMMMPGTDGWKVCRTIRAFSKVPIAILSALDESLVISSALDAGADDYLVKPIPSGVLIAHINNLTRRALVENNKATMLRQTGSFRDTGPFKNKIVRKTGTLKEAGVLAQNAAQI